MKSFIQLYAAFFITFCIINAGCTRLPVREVSVNIPNGGCARTIAQHPTIAHRALVISESAGMFYKYGARWKQVSGSQNWHFSDVHYYRPNPSIVLATAFNSGWKAENTGGIYRSTNSGYNWSKVSFQTGLQLIATCIAEDDNHRLWVGTSLGLFYSDDQGLSWQVDTNISGEYICAIHIQGRNKKVITRRGFFVSDNGSVLWEFKSTLPVVSSFSFQNQIAVSPYDHRHIFWAGIFTYTTAQGETAYGTGLFRSWDNGTTWTKLRGYTTANRQPFVAITPAQRADKKFDVYYGNGYLEMTKITYEDQEIPDYITSRTLSVDHPDCADISFKLDGITPGILTSDGGIHTSEDNGNTWTLTGGVSNGFNALEVTGIAGQQKSNPGMDDLYFSTWHNNLWVTNSVQFGYSQKHPFAGEGYNLEVPRNYYDDDKTQVTGYVAGGLGYFSSGKLYSDWKGFKYVNKNGGDIKLLKPGHYIQNDTDPEGEGEDFYLTRNNGDTWQRVYTTDLRTYIQTKIAGSSNNPVVFTPVRLPGATPDGRPMIGLLKVSNLLSGQRIVSEVSGFGSIGVFVASANYYVYGVDPHDPDHIIIPDIISNRVKVTFDGGLNWSESLNLTELVTSGGTYPFSQLGRPQISWIEFDPDNSGVILVGTNEAGILKSCDNGGSWHRIPESVNIPAVSGFFFRNDGTAIAASHGRGLWVITKKECPGIPDVAQMPGMPAGTPFLFDGASITPLANLDIKNLPPAAAFHFVKGGEILNLKTSQQVENTILSEIEINAGDITSVNSKGKTITTTAGVQRSTATATTTPFSGILKNAIAGGYKLKGIYTNGDTLIGTIFSKSDLTSTALPVSKGVQRTLKVKIVESADSLHVRSLIITGTNFKPGCKLSITIDDEIEGKIEATPDAAGRIKLTINKWMQPGTHLLLLRQACGEDKISEAVYFIVPPIAD